MSNEIYVDCPHCGTPRPITRITLCEEKERMECDLCHKKHTKFDGNPP